jgi:hypothetical protein
VTVALHTNFNRLLLHILRHIRRLDLSYRGLVSQATMRGEGNTRTTPDNTLQRTLKLVGIDLLFLRHFSGVVWCFECGVA